VETIKRQTGTLFSCLVVRLACVCGLSLGLQPMLHVRPSLWRTALWKLQLPLMVLYFMPVLDKVCVIVHYYWQITNVFRGRLRRVLPLRAMSDGVPRRQPTEVRRRRKPECCGTQHRLSASFWAREIQHASLARSHRLVLRLPARWAATVEYVGHATNMYFNVHCCVLFSCRVRVRIRVSIRFSVWLCKLLCTCICATLRKWRKGSGLV